MNEYRSGNVCHLAGGRPTTFGSIKLSCESPNNTCTDFAAESSYQREFCRYVPPPTLSSHGAKNMNALKYSSPKACISLTLRSRASYDSADDSIVLNEEISVRYARASCLSAVVVVRRRKVDRRVRTSKKIFKQFLKCVPDRISALLR